MTEPTTLQMPLSQTAREIIEKLHPAIKDDWRLKLLKVESETIEAHLQGARQRLHDRARSGLLNE